MTRLWKAAGGLLVVVLLVAVALSITILVRDERSSLAGRCDVVADDDEISRQVRLTTTDDWVEFELWSSEPFPTRALFPVVRIGSRDFSRSRYGADGRLNTLIFSIPRTEFDRLSSDDPVWVYYGGAGSPPPLDHVPEETDPWSFGAFNKGLLDCPATVES